MAEILRSHLEPAFRFLEIDSSPFGVHRVTVLLMLLFFVADPIQSLSIEQMREVLRFQATVHKHVAHQQADGLRLRQHPMVKTVKSCSNGWMIWMVIVLIRVVTCAQGAVKGTLGMVQGWAITMGGGPESIHPASRGGAAHTASLFWIVTRTHTHTYICIYI